MAKVQNLAGISPSIPFTEFNFYEVFNQSFENSELGRIKRLLPLHEMAEAYGLTTDTTKARRGRKSYFTGEGKIALMFLRMITGLSCPKLMESLNANIHHQIFCGVMINPADPLRNYKLLDDIFLELAKKLDMQKMQEILAKAWNPYLEDIRTVLMDGTCYESEIRYPNDQKLLWECVEQSYAVMKDICAKLGENLPRTKYRELSRDVLAYAKQRNHSKKNRRKMIRRELQLLKKIMLIVLKMIRKSNVKDLVDGRTMDRLDNIALVHRQQRLHFEKNDPHNHIKDRIVSISKPYVRPIVRGKETKKVEFGAKSNNIIVGGMSFIEHISFDSFNEGTRLVQSIELHKKLFGVDANRLGGDQGYAGKENRDYCKDHDITTSFVKRGRPSKDVSSIKDTVRSELGKVRATVMEGSFGTQKEHYDLKRNKARRKETELLYIFFGVHAANVVQLAQQILNRSEKAA